MIHQCKLNCRSLDPAQSDILGIEDPGKWLPFAFHMSVVVAIKLTTDDDNLPTVGCTTVFTDGGDSYIIDTPFNKFNKIFVDFNADLIIDVDDDSNENDLEL